MNQRRRLVLVIIFLILLAGTIFLLVNSSQDKPNPALSDQGPVSLQDKADLSGMLLNQQYNDFLFTISDFIHQNISPGDNLAVIQTAQVMPNGVVEARIKTSSPKQITFTATIDRSQYNQLTIDVNAYKYHKVVQVY